ncbi:MAG: Zn-ribbon domain-containing OB-fold protein [Chloroflexi bacterium]|nr:Zn-ribbon domain-containing OB-fold protein [Chloroflexota bacterium]
MSEPSLPSPTPTPDTEEFWQRAKQQKLVLQRCRDCHQYTFPPRPTCTVCGSNQREWVKASGRGKVYTFVITHQPVHPGLQGKTPWNIVVVELEEGVHVISNIVQCALQDIQIGLPVEAVFEDVTSEITLPKFRVAAQGRSA